MCKMNFSLGSIFFLSFVFLPLGVEAQAPAGCRVVGLDDPPRQVLRCASGLTIEAEKDTAYRVSETGKGEPDAVQLNGRAVLVEVPPGRRGGFQVLTPHAVASVRGTLYAVDVQEAQTSVFVSRGRVRVAGRRSVSSVVLGPGQGVDVVPGTVLEVKTWGAERVAKLMARFGR